MTKKEMYKTLSKRYHPDVGGDEETFKKINQAYEDGIVFLADVYEELLNEEVKLDLEITDTIDKITEQGKAYDAYHFNSIRTSGGYNTATANGMMDFWADSLMDRVDRIKFIDNVIVEEIEVKIIIKWIKNINGRDYWQTSSANGKFWNFEDYSDAIINSLKVMSISEVKNA